METTLAIELRKEATDFICYLTNSLPPSYLDHLRHISFCFKPSNTTMYMQYDNHHGKNLLLCFSRDKFSRQQAFYVGT